MAKTSEGIVSGNRNVEFQIGNVGDEWGLYLFINSELIMSQYGTEEKIRAKFNKACENLE